MGQADYYKHGSWNTICDRCGRKYKADQLLLEWDGLRTCRQCTDIRNPQDFARALPDPRPLPWTRPDPPDQFIPKCTGFGRLSTPGVMVVGCWTIGRNFGGFGYTSSQLQEAAANNNVVA